MCQWHCDAKYRPPRQFRRQRRVPQVEFFDRVIDVFVVDAATSVIEAESLEHEADVPSFNEAQLKAHRFCLTQRTDE